MNLRRLGAHPRDVDSRGVGQVARISARTRGVHGGRRRRRRTRGMLQRRRNRRRSAITTTLLLQALSHLESFERQLGDQCKTPKEPRESQGSDLFGTEPILLKDTLDRLEALLSERIVVLDGSWGVLIQRDVRGEEAYRGERFARPSARRRRRPRPAQPDAAGDRRRHPPRATSQPAPTSRRRTRSRRRASARPTTGSQDVRRRDERRRRAARARSVADEVATRFVAGSVGPLNVTLSLSPQRRRSRPTAP